MARKLLKRFMPDPDWVREHKSLQFLGDWLHKHPNLWHLNRRSVPSAFFIGIFMSFVPVPSQMALAAIAAIACRANLVISVALVWISNPLTMPPMFYFAYKVGLAVTGAPAGEFTFELTWQWLSDGLAQVWYPFIVGCLSCGLFFGLLGSTAIRIYWRWHVIHHWHKRRLNNKNDQNA
jgi:uncharacterized protein (DUF2062 family)